MSTSSIVVAVASITAIFVGLSIILNPERKNLNGAVRARQGGSYVRLTEGITHYALEGPSGGPVIVLIHGGITPMVTWDAYIPALKSAGFRVLRYDAYGRGYSDRPDITYDRSLYRQQLLDLLNCLNIAEPVDLVGYSHGGGIAVNFAAHYPERVHQLALIAPIVHRFSLRPLLNPPLIGEFFARLTALREIPNLLKSKHKAGPAKQIAEALFEQTTYKGFQRSLLSMARSDAISDYLGDYQALSRQAYQVLLIRGTRDSEITQEAIEAVRKLLPQAEFHAIADHTHGIVFENPSQVCPLLVDFLR